MEERVAHTLGHLYALAQEFPPVEGVGWCYRGQADLEWSLIPKAGRPEYFDARWNQNTMDQGVERPPKDLGRFRAWRDHAIAFSVDLPSNDFECLAYAQHLRCAEQSDTQSRADFDRLASARHASRRNLNEFSFCASSPRPSSQAPTTTTSKTRPLSRFCDGRWATPPSSRMHKRRSANLASSSRPEYCAEYDILRSWSVWIVTLADDHTLRRGCSYEVNNDEYLSGQW